MRVRILGSAAGGGFPQWNCHCDTCEAARDGTRARPRTQSSLAIRGEEGPWYLINASPDARQQLEALAPDERDVVRAPPVAGVLLTDAEIDHTAGLLLLRESATPLRIYGDAGVRRALSDGFPVLRMLDSYCGVRWSTLAPGETTALPASSLTVEPFPAGGDPPRYCNASGGEPAASGFIVRDRVSTGTVVYAPGLAGWDDTVLARLRASDLVLVDGTFWRDDELPRLGISRRTARDMGHVPLSGPDGTLAVLAPLYGPRRALVHINNTNPILLEDSPERAAVLAAGIEVGDDGLEFAL